MAKPSVVASQIGIKIDSKSLPAEPFGLLAEATVDQHAYLPHHFTLRFYDPSLKLLDGDLFQLMGKVEINAQDGDGKEVVLIEGEITSIEPDFKEGMNAELVVRGYDISHHLYRITNSTTYLNSKDSDLATKIAKKIGLKTDIETTPTVYDHIYQDNQSDLHFLMQRAWRIGYECYVDGGTLHFHLPRNKAGESKLIWGQELLSFTPRLSVTEQVDRVIVRGWDINKKAAIVGEAQKGRLYPQLKGKKNNNDAPWEKPFPEGKLVIVDQPVVSQEEARRLAAARLDEVSGALIEADGVAFRRPDIRAGKTVELEGLGKRFSGSYLITASTHIYTSSGLTTNFSVKGSRTGLLTEHLADLRNRTRWSGVVPAIVTNTDDPRNWGRVKVKFPWMSEEDESDWARVISVGAGVQAGLFAMPAVNDEVIVSFVQGDFSQPLVLGGVWNGSNAIPDDGRGASKGEKPKVRLWRSLTGHQIAMHDDKQNKVELKTAKGHKLTIDDANQKITIMSKSGLEITLNDNGNEISVSSKGKVVIKAASELQIESDGNLNLKANGNIQVEAMGNLQLKGTGNASLQSAAKVGLSAPAISLG